MFSCFVLHIFSNFSRLVYLSVGFVRITVDVCNPQNCTEVKFGFYVPLRLSSVVFQIVNQTTSRNAIFCLPLLSIIA